MARPRLNQEGQSILDKLDTSISSITKEAEKLDPSTIKSVETEQQTKLSKREERNLPAHYLKPVRSVNTKERFNENYRKDWEKGWEYVRVVVENREIIGEAVEVWTKKFAGDPANFWKVPVNTPVYIPRLLAEQLSKCHYIRYKMEDRVTQADSYGQYTGAMVAETTVDRLVCRPAGEEFSSTGSGF